MNQVFGNRVVTPADKRAINLGAYDEERMSHRNNSSKLDQIDSQPVDVPKLKIDKLSKGKKKRIMSKRVTEDVSEKHFINLDQIGRNKKHDLDT